MHMHISAGGQAYSHSGDDKLMQRLGLKTNFGRDWTDVGTVVVEEAATECEYNSVAPRPAATVKVEVSAMPAQFFRFTITRPQDAVEDLEDGTWRAVYEPVERFEITTGSGNFGEYWPTAQAVARNMLSVKRLDD